MDAKEIYTGWHEDFDAYLGDRWEMQEDYFDPREIEPEEEEQ